MREDALVDAVFGGEVGVEVYGGFVEKLKVGSHDYACEEVGITVSAATGRGRGVPFSC